MKTLTFLIIVIVSGFLAGLVHSFLNIAFVEPYLDNAIGIENQRLFAEGQAQNNPQFWNQFSDYRMWQKQGSIVSGAILGTATGALFGLVFAYSRNVLPGKNDIQKALVLAGIMWATLYFIPFLKYPANPPTVGDPETVVLRGILYLTFIALSGFGAVGFYKLSQKLKTKKFIAFIGYATFIGVIFVAMPGNPDRITTPMNLVDHFRTMSAFTVSIYWLSLGIIFGSLWNHYKPHKEIPPSFN